jgi:RNA polymerase sigma factor (sigma-70 family)
MAVLEITQANLSEIVALIQDGSEQAKEELYRRLSRGMRLLIRRQVDEQDVEDVLHISFRAVVLGIRSEKIELPEALISFVRTTVARQIGRKLRLYDEIERPMNSASVTPEHIDLEQQEHMRQCLHQLTKRDRDILVRFYVLKQSKEQICSELNLSDASFKRYKSHAKARLTERTGDNVTAWSQARARAGQAA